MSPTTADQRPTGTFFSRLYTGTGAFDIVGQRRRWYALSAGLILVCLLSIVLRGFSFGIDFSGGTKLNVPLNGAGGATATVEQVESTVSDALGEEPSEVRIVGQGDGRMAEVEMPYLSDDEIGAAKVALAETFQPEDRTGQTGPAAVGDSTVSETWGSTITTKALIALVVFLVLVGIYIAIRFERDMAFAALIAMLFDTFTTAGIYSLVGFEVTPATVIGLLTILGFSLYDTVVVFDKVDELTKGLQHQRSRTYDEAANLAVNQTLMRSINTTVIGVLPVVSLMIIAVWLLGVGTLQDLALVQLVGIMVGTYSSIFLATPLLVSMKMRSREIKRHHAAVTNARTAQQTTSGFGTNSAAAGGNPVA